MRNVIGFLGFILALYGIVSAIAYSNITWYSYFIVGGACFFYYLNSKLKNKSIFKLTDNKKEVFKIYPIYLILGILIEFVGRFLFHFWEYPKFQFTDEVVHVYLIGYPFTFFYLYEFFTLVNSKVQNLGLSITSTTIINAFLIEFINTFAGEWKYRIPYITLEILEVNILVVIGWVILALIPLAVKRVLTSKT